MKIEIEIKNCKECPNLDSKKVYTPDSFDDVSQWTCNINGKSICNYIEWHEESKIDIPNWCHINNITQILKKN